MKSLVLALPDNVEINEQEVKTLLAAKLFEQGTLSMGQAAEMAGYSKRTFMELLGKYNVSILDIDEKELENDILNAKNYHI